MTNRRATAVQALGISAASAGLYELVGWGYAALLVGAALVAFGVVAETPTRPLTAEERSAREQARQARRRDRKRARVARRAGGDGD